VFDNQNLCTFLSAPGETDAEYADDGRRIDRMTAIAASACLPFIQPWRDQGARYADGGLYSNLPINVLLSQGSMGADCVVCILATPLADLHPTTNYIDYRSSVLLHELRERQAPRRVVTGRAMVGPAIRGTPVFLISPRRELDSGLVCGFFSRETLDADTKLGRLAGEAFAAAVKSFLIGKPDALRLYDVSLCHLPPLPASPPALANRWVHWVNPRWHPHWEAR
jgi:predicted acylesterase/phospholipase RssA